MKTTFFFWGGLLPIHSFIHSFLSSSNFKNLRSQTEVFSSASPINTPDMPASGLFISWVAFLNPLHCFFPTMFSQEIIAKEAKVMYHWTHFRKTISTAGIQANCCSWRHSSLERARFHVGHHLCCKSHQELCRGLASAHCAHRTPSPSLILPFSYHPCYHHLYGSPGQQ